MIKNPDPRFPNRPQHPDFDRLSKVVREMDAQVDAGSSAEEMIKKTCNPDVVAYVSEQRMVFLRVSGSHVPVYLGAAIWVDGFVAGYRLRQSEESG